MEGNTRIRLYQFPNSPYCIPIRLLLDHTGVPYELINLHYCEPSPVVTVTQGAYYMVPVTEDLLSGECIYERGEGTQDVPKHITNIAQWDIFPEAQRGLHEILLRYIEEDIESFGHKVCDALHERWCQTDLERGLMRRHKERKFGVGCLDHWRRDLDELTEGFNTRLRALNQMLGNAPFLLGEKPVFADYALYGVIGNFLYPGTTQLSNEFAYMQVWHKRMTEADFKKPLVGGASEEADTSDAEAGHHVNVDAHLTDTSDIAAAMEVAKVSAGRKALNVGCGAGHMAVYLAADCGLNVTACDSTPEMVEDTQALAAERGVKLAVKEHSAEELPYESSSFDVVGSRMAVRHLANPHNFAAEAARVLKMYGHLVIIDGCNYDDHPEVATWLNDLERLRDPSHIKFTRPADWRRWLKPLAMTIQKIDIDPVMMSDLERYMDAAGMDEDRKNQMREMVARAPSMVREVLRVGQEGANTVWYWPRLIMVASKI